MAGLIGAGRSTLGQATTGFRTTAALEQQRNATGDALKSARAAQRSSMVSTGAGLGASYGIQGLAAASQPLTIAGGTVTGAAGAGAGAAGAAGATAAGAGTGATMIGGTTVATAGTGTALTAGMAPVAAEVAGTTLATGSTGAMATIGAVATPLLIGAGAALLLDSLFDIF